MRRETYRFVLKRDETRDRAILAGVRDRDVRIFNLALTAISGGCPIDVARALMPRLESPELSDELRARGIRALADTSHADVRAWLGRRATTRHWLFRTLRLRKSSLELSAIITALAIRNEDHAESKQSLRSRGRAGIQGSAERRCSATRSRHAMTEAIRFLTSLAQALAKCRCTPMDILHVRRPPTRRSRSFASCRRWTRRRASHSSARSVVYGDRAIRELADWDWSARLSGAGVQRIEFPESVDPEEYRGFLEEILTNIALVAGGKLRSEAEQALGRLTPIRFGAIGVRASQEHSTTIEEADTSEPALQLDLTEEADVVMWMHDEVAARGRLPLVEAEIVIDSLASAMHQQANALVPLLTLKEFDQYTTTHALNVAVLAMGLAEHLGLSTREVRAYGVAGLLHDLGKVKVPVEIVQKPGALTPEERAIMCQHPVDGARVILESDNRLDLSAAVAFEHHIMIDGGGYPSRRSSARLSSCEHARARLRCIRRVAHASPVPRGVGNERRRGLHHAAHEHRISSGRRARVRGHAAGA